MSIPTDSVTATRGCKSKDKGKGKSRGWYSLCLGMLMAGSWVGEVFAQASEEPAQSPLFLSAAVAPIMMLNLSKDHQLFFKMYDDYGDITDPIGGPPDAIPDTTYNNFYNYYGYFDAEKCYTYSATLGAFTPESKTKSGYCNQDANNQWSGNFLNWATMTRIDAIRKILYGGLRDTDTADSTILSRSMLPNDAHSFAKYYTGADLHRLTPFSSSAIGRTGQPGITLCNTTNGDNLLSQFVTAPPLIRVARGNFLLWASNERYQCKWREQIERSEYGVNGNDPLVTGIMAAGDSPNQQDKLGSGSAAGEFQVRVQVCAANLLEENCKHYLHGQAKPIGLLQEYGESGRIEFGLMTGSYTRNRDGGVLRKAVGSLRDEINVQDGTFVKPNLPATGIIDTLNRLKIYGYQFGDGEHAGIYHDNNAANHRPTDVNATDNCYWGVTAFGNGHCTNWGNPQAEILLESLLYLAGSQPTSAYSADAGDYLPTAQWQPPVTEKNYCAPLSVLQLTAASPSFDGDNLTGFTALGNNLAAYTDAIAGPQGENLSGKYFVGRADSANDELCTGKSISRLSSVRGTCPDAPRAEGSYQLAGLAYFARSQDLIPTLKGEQNVRTFGIALAQALPQVDIKTPNNRASIAILPACQNRKDGASTNCAIVDFKIIAQHQRQLIAAREFSDARAVLNNQQVNSGRLYVNWEDSEQGGDYDQDMWGLIDYWVSDSHAVIATRVIAQSTGDPMGFGFVLSGTTDDGFHVLSGINAYSGGDCSDCNLEDAANFKVFSIGAGAAKFLETPLYYAAKWGGYDAALAAEATRLAGSGASDTARERALMQLIRNRDTTDTYAFAGDPRRLQASLASAFSQVTKMQGAAGKVSSLTRRVGSENLVVQTQFTSDNWRGEVNLYRTDNQGVPLTTPAFSSRDATVFDSNPAARNILVGQKRDARDWLVPFRLDSLTESQLAVLKASLSDLDDVLLNKMINWLRGSAADEGQLLRARGQGATRNLLGDIVNANAVIASSENFNLHRLNIGGDSYRSYVLAKQARAPQLFVATNDGMLHSFLLPSASDPQLRENFAFIPNLVLPKLLRVTQSDYGSSRNPHQYLLDGRLTVGDAYDPDREIWRTILIGSLGAGGKGVFALDISDPAAPQLLWERDAEQLEGLGFILGDLQIAPLANGRFGVIFGNGILGETTASLMLVDALSGNLIRSLDTPQGRDLATPALLLDTQGVVTAAYAGDITGHVWKFALDSQSPRNWRVDHLLLQANYMDANGDSHPQAITAAPTLGRNLARGGQVMVYLGTGRYFSASDALAPGNANNINSAPDSFYALLDTGTTHSRLALYPKKLVSGASATSGTTRNLIDAAEHPLDWQTSSGWYFDFPKGSGERVLAKPALIQDRLVFATVIPSTAACTQGGGSWLMDIPATGNFHEFDRRPRDHQLLEHNHYFDTLILGDLYVMLTEKEGSLLASGADARLLQLPAKLLPQRHGRQSWRQVQ